MTPEFERHAKLASELVSSAEEHGDELLAGRDIRPFLELMVRLPDFGAHNLLLILEQYPRATFLARGSYWKERAASEPVLRPEWAGKGIDLVLPALDGGALVGYATRFYDVRQTKDADDCDIPSVKFFVSDVRKAAEKKLLQFGQLIVPDDDVEFEHDFLDAPEEADVAAMATRFIEFTEMYFETMEMGEGLDILPAILTQSVILACGYPAPALTEEGRELLEPDDPIQFLDTVQRKYQELLTVLGL